MFFFKIADGIEVIVMCRANELKKTTQMSDKHASTAYTDIQEIRDQNNT